MLNVSCMEVGLEFEICWVWRGVGGGGGGGGEDVECWRGGCCVDGGGCRGGEGVWGVGLEGEVVEEGVDWEGDCEDRW